MSEKINISLSQKNIQSRISITHLIYYGFNLIEGFCGSCN